MTGAPVRCVLLDVVEGGMLMGQSLGEYEDLGDWDPMLLGLDLAADLAQRGVYLVRRGAGHG